MKYRPVNAEQRLLVAKTVLEMIQVYAKAYAPEASIADMATDVMIGCAVFVGQAERRPVTASDISAMTGIARSTVIRRIQSCQERGRITTRRDGRRIVVESVAVNDPEVLRQVEAAIRRVVHRFAEAAELSNAGT